MSKLATYSPQEVDVIIGSYKIEGFSDSSMVSIAPTTPAFSMKVGIDGEHARTRAYDLSATMTLTLLGTSLSNQVLTDLHKADRNAPNGSGVFDVRVVDKAGNDVCEASKAYVMNWPEIEFGSEVTDREWEIMLVDYRPNFGGSPDAAV